MGSVIGRRGIRDEFVRLPFSAATPKSTLHNARTLVSFLGSFDVQFHHDRRKTCRHTLRSILRWYRISRDVVVYPFNRIGSRKRQVAVEHLAECAVERIHVASRDGTIWLIGFVVFPTRQDDDGG